MANSDPVILISGASRGIGAAITRRLAPGPWRLSLGARDTTVLQNREWPADSDIFLQNYDAADRAAAQRWVEATLDHFGRIDGLINCAGILLSHQLEDEDESALDRMWEINVKGTMRLTRAAFPHLQAAGNGRVINLVSMSGKRVKGISAGYSMTKFAQMALTQATRNAGWEHGVRTTAICPSWVNTDMANRVGALSPEAMTQPEDVADLVATILSLPNTAHVNEVTVNCSLET